MNNIWSQISFIIIALTINYARLSAMLTCDFIDNYTIAFNVFSAISILRRIIQTICIFFNFFIKIIKYSFITWVSSIKVSSTYTKEEIYVIISQDVVFRSI